MGIPSLYFEEKTIKILGIDIFENGTIYIKIEEASLLNRIYSQIERLNTSLMISTESTIYMKYIPHISIALLNKT